MPLAPVRLVALFVLAACSDGQVKAPGEAGDTTEVDTDEDPDATVDSDTEPVPTDADGDGFSTEAEGGDDCDDADADVHPWAEEVCEDGVDEDCDGIDGRCGAWPSGDMAYVADAAFWGERAGDGAGYKVLLEDMNGDDLDDALISAPNHDSYATDAGALYVAFAPFTEGGVPLSLADARVDGMDGDEKLFNFAAGDADGDGDVDLLLGSVVSEEALFITGPIAGELTSRDAAWRMDGPVAESFYNFIGSALDIADLDGDGAGELIVGAKWAEDDRSYPVGEVYVLPGTVRGETDFYDVETVALATLAGRGPTYGEVDGAGAILTHGDFDGDGLSDLVIGFSATVASGLHVVLSPVSGNMSLDDADATWDMAPDAWMGACTAGDLDGDGALDMVIGTPDEETSRPGAGAVYVLSGYVPGMHTLAEASTKLLGMGQYEGAGTSVALGDFDGDSRVDVAVGAQGYGWSDSTPVSGGVYVVYEVPSGTTPLLELAGSLWTTTGTDWLGCSMASGDTDGSDGTDLFVGAEMSLYQTTEAGAAYLMNEL